jgi:hypothetical protein
MLVVKGSRDHCMSLANDLAMFLHGDGAFVLKTLRVIKRTGDPANAVRVSQV